MLLRVLDLMTIRRTAFTALTLMLALLASSLAPPAQAQSGDEVVLKAREALRARNGAALAAARQAVNAAGHPLALWVEYWELGNRLAQAQQEELDAFYARWPGSYVEDRLRNDWLLELGQRRDWANFRTEFPRFRMNDDREVTCYALLTQHLDGLNVADPARDAWFAQREPQDGCRLMATTLFEAGVFKRADAWQKARLAIQANRPRVAQDAVALAHPGYGRAMAGLVDNPAHWLRRRSAGHAGSGHELELLALMRVAATDPELAASLLADPWEDRLPRALAATAWAHTARQAALKRLPQADAYARRAWQVWDADARHRATAPPWNDDLLAWHVRAALRQPADEASRWVLMTRAVDAMSAEGQRDSAWVYWRARATEARADPGPEGDAARAVAALALQSIAPELSFYGKLATEELGGSQVLPPAPRPL
ncbi:MAG TPA: lytic transglycosylase domain-containing protein, partial [Rubrivivax sp.]|nr:lytic transglycosylase domain-containing protein [Rubrivivax sp.]